MEYFNDQVNFWALESKLYTPNEKSITRINLPTNDHQRALTPTNIEIGMTDCIVLILWVENYHLSLKQPQFVIVSTNQASNNSIVW